MAIKRAKTLTPEQFDNLLAHIDRTSREPIRDRLIVMLSYKAGLRSSEISKIDMSALTDAEGRIAPMIRIYSNVGKKGRERLIPMHPDIQEALKAFRRRYPHHDRIAFNLYKPTEYLNPTSLTQWFWRMYREAGFEGCSSHSGRRTFGTALARRANKFHNSLRDVQRLLGHANLQTTEGYIEPSDDTAAMIMSL